MTNRTHPTSIHDIEHPLLGFSLDDFPQEEVVEPDTPATPTSEALASSLMGQVIYQIKRRIRELAQDEVEGMNQKKLAERMGIPQSQLSRLLGGQANTTLLTVSKAAIALGLTNALLKLIPQEDEADQEDELKAFVQGDEKRLAWWPLTRRKPALWMHATAEIDDAIAKPTTEELQRTVTSLQQATRTHKGLDTQLSSVLIHLQSHITVWGAVNDYTEAMRCNAATGVFRSRATPKSSTYTGVLAEQADF